MQVYTINRLCFIVELLDTIFKKVEVVKNFYYYLCRHLALEWRFI